MQRRTFLGWCIKTVAAAALITHLKFGELVPVPHLPATPEEAADNLFIAEAPFYGPTMGTGWEFRQIQGWTCLRVSDPTESIAIKIPDQGIIERGDVICLDDETQNAWNECPDWGAGCYTGAYCHAGDV